MQKLQWHTSLLQLWFKKCTVPNKLGKVITLTINRSSHMRLAGLRLFNSLNPSSRKVTCVGIIFDQTRPWNEHVNNVANKTLARISELYPPIEYHRNLSFVFRLQLYVKCIRPATFSGCEAWVLNRNLVLKTSDGINHTLMNDWKMSPNNKY
jgi:hypothetical protein